MDKAHADTVRLLLAAAPDVFANDIFAMKGGTAINLFVRDMPRLSVDIDAVYMPRQTPRDEAFAAISGELDGIAKRLARQGMRTRKVASKDLGDTKLLIEREDSLVKVEVNECDAWTERVRDRFSRCKIIGSLGLFAIGCQRAAQALLPRAASPA